MRKGAKLGVKDGRETYVGLDIGPTGKLLKPMGDLDLKMHIRRLQRWQDLAKKQVADLHPYRDE